MQQQQNGNELDLISYGLTQPIKIRVLTTDLIISFGANVSVILANQETAVLFEKVDKDNMQ